MHDINHETFYEEMEYQVLYQILMHVYKPMRKLLNVIEKNNHKEIDSKFVKLTRNSPNCDGHPAHNCAIDTCCFFSKIKRYFFCAFLAFNPCQGRVPLRK